MSLPRPPRGLRAGVATSVLAALVAPAGCRPPLPEPPDPGEPTPALPCDAPLPAWTLSRIEADSLLESPPWLQVCAPCPAASGEVEVRAPGAGALALEAGWGPGRSCIVAMPTEPLPAVPTLPSTVALVDPTGRGATLDVALPVAGGRGADPADLDGAAYVLPLVEASARMPGGLALLPALPAAALLVVGAPESDGRRPLLLGGAHDVGAQDLCVPTAPLATPAALSSRQLAAPLVGGDPVPGGLLAARGAVQARLAPDGSALLDVAFVLLVDLAASEVLTGVPPADACAAHSVALGFDPCVPCGDPADGIDGLPACLPLVIEGARAERAAFLPVPVDPDALPADCAEPDGDDDSSR